MHSARDGACRVKKVGEFGSVTSKIASAFLVIMSTMVISDPLCAEDRKVPFDPVRDAGHAAECFVAYVYVGGKDGVFPYNVDLKSYEAQGFRGINEIRKYLDVSAKVHGGKKFWVDVQARGYVEGEQLLRSDVVSPEDKQILLKSFRDEAVKCDVAIEEWNKSELR
jgi:hypothetical protein